VGVVTINMPRIAHVAKTKEEFFCKLGKLMDIAKQSLEIKREVVETLTDGGLHPYTKVYLGDIKKKTGSYWQHHFSTIGIIGMNDAILNFLNTDIGSEKGQEFALSVLDYMRDRILEYQQETGNLYNLEATPAEGTSYRLARLDYAKHPDIRVYNKEKYNGRRGTEPYYTNSTQLPVGYTTDVFEALDLQDELQCKYTGGTVFHAFIGEDLNQSIVSLKKLIRRIAEMYKMPYFTITPTFSICPVHGYLPGEHPTCPTCKAEGKRNKCEVYSRVVGYLRPVSQWNKGKQTEFTDRKTYKVT
jgi:ribonucleoside-triphosphate reductase